MLQESLNFIVQVILSCKFDVNMRYTISHISYHIQKDVMLYYYSVFQHCRFKTLHHIDNEIMGMPVLRNLQPKLDYKLTIALLYIVINIFDSMKLTIHVKSLSQIDLHDFPKKKKSFSHLIKTRNM